VGTGIAKYIASPWTAAILPSSSWNTLTTASYKLHTFLAASAGADGSAGEDATAAAPGATAAPALALDAASFAASPFGYSNTPTQLRSSSRLRFVACYGRDGRQRRKPQLLCLEKQDLLGARCCFLSSLSPSLWRHTQSAEKGIAALGILIERLQSLK